MSQTTAETTTTTESLQTELRGIALLLREHADAEDISLRDFISQHPGLGSDKTLSQLCKGHWDDIKAANWIDAYRQVRDALTTQDTSTALYDDLSTAKRVRSATTRLKLSQTLAKLVIVKGFTGSGKTSALEIIAGRYNAMTPTRQVFSAEASAGWNDRPSAMLGELLTALGHDAGPNGQTKRMHKCIEVLGQRGVMVTIDEVHDLGPRCLRVLKTLLNRTAVKLIIACHPRLWRDLEREASDDLSQLTGNRLLSVVDLGTFAEEDMEILLKRKLPAPGLNGELKQAAKLVSEAALGRGNLAFGREVIVRLNRAAKRKGTTSHLTLADVQKAVSQEINAR